MDGSQMKSWICVFSFFRNIPQIAPKQLCQIPVMCFIFCIVFMTPALNVFLVLTGVSHQCHLLWQHLSHHLQKIQQILWPAGNHPSIPNCFPSLHCAGGASIESLYLFPFCAFRTCEPTRLFVQINLQAWWLFPALVPVFHPLTPLWISAWVSNWSGSRGDMACICHPYRVAATCLISLSLSLCGVSLSLPFLLPDLMFSSLPHPQNVRELTGLFMEQAGKLKGEFNVLNFMAVFKWNPTWRRLSFSGGGRFYERSWGLHWNHCTVPLP